MVLAGTAVWPSKPAVCLLQADKHRAAIQNGLLPNRSPARSTAPRARTRNPRAWWRGGLSHSCARADDRPGGRFGLIRFGSRLDVYLPEGGKSLVSEGQTAVAGETVLADFAAARTGGLSVPINHPNGWIAGGFRRMAERPAIAISMASHDAVRSEILPKCAAAGSARFRCACWCRTSSRCWRSARA